MPYISISHVIRDKRKAYYRAIEDVETHGRDLTYFLHYSCDITRKAIENLWQIIDSYSLNRTVKKQLEEKGYELNKRQLKVINMLAVSGSHIDLKKYKNKFRVAYETARTDLRSLEKNGILIQIKVGKKFVYRLREEIL